MAKKKKDTKPPSAHIVVSEDPDKFLKEVNEYFEKGYRPIQDMHAFAEIVQKTGEWKTLYVMPLVHYEELKEFQTIPTGDDSGEEGMFG